MDIRIVDVYIDIMRKAGEWWLSGFREGEVTSEVTQVLSVCSLPPLRGFVPGEQLIIWSLLSCSNSQSVCTKDQAYL